VCAADLATGRDPNRIRIFDTTLRDGEQSPGASLTSEEKMIIARQLAKLGVDVIEAGFPVSSVGDFDAVRAIASSVGNLPDAPIICGLSRALTADVDRCWAAVKAAAFPRIHLFIATSDLRMEHKLHKSRAQVLATTSAVVAHAASLCEDVEFSAEDAVRSDPTFLFEVLSAAVAAGATTINVPDTVGCGTPSELYKLIRGVRANVVGADNVTISVHGHDDLGMAVANFLSAIEAGARQLECTINGIGERAGNAALEEVVMALHVRRNYFNERIGRTVGSPPLTNINHEEIYHTSRLVSSLTGILVQPNKAIVRANAFSHESVIRQDGVLKNPETYEILSGRSVGIKDSDSLVLSKLSGRHAFRTRLAELGYDLTDEEVNRTLARFKELADTKKTVSNWDIESIVNDEVRAVDAPRVVLHCVQVSTGNMSVPTATIKLSVVKGAGEEAGTTISPPSPIPPEMDGEVTMSATGTGPVDATFKAINAAVGHLVNVALEEYTVSSVSEGIDALGEATVRLKDGATGRRYVGSSSDTDVVVASAHAYVRAINRCTIAKDTPEPIHPQRFGTL